ncbi:hypothetical protein QQ045_014055 [Rhodiola kirilowii]
MMNVLALVLVATSLAAAGIWSPPAATTTQKQIVDHSDVSEVTVKEGHRVIVVEYDKEQTGNGNTKVSISPPHDGGDADRVPPVEADDGGGGGGGVKEVICDAIGKCKEVITSVVGGGRRKVGDKVDEVEQEVKNVGDKVADKAEDVKHGAKDAVLGAKDDVMGRAKQGAEIAKEGARKGADKANEAVDSARICADNVKGATVHNARKGADKAKEIAHNAHQTVTSLGKQMTEQAKYKAKQGVEVAEEAVEKVAENAKAGAEKVKEEGKQELREIYDLGNQLARHIWSYLAWGRTLSSVMGLLHLLGFCMAYGMAVWVTFLSSNVLSRALPRQQFGVLQSKMYPVYFRAMGYSVGMSLLGHLLAQRRRLWAERAEMFQGYNLAFAFAMVMINLHYLEPRASKVMFERMREEKEEGRGRDPYLVSEPTRSTTTTKPTVTSDVHSTGTQEKPTTNDKSQDRIVFLSQRLKKLNSQSSLVNVLSLMSLTWHLVHLSQRLNGC